MKDDLKELLCVFQMNIFQLIIPHLKEAVVRFLHKIDKKNMIKNKKQEWKIATNQCPVFCVCEHSACPALLTKVNLRNIEQTLTIK